MLRTQQAKAHEDIYKPVQKLQFWLELPKHNVDLHVDDWVTTQQEDPILKTVIKWIPHRKVQDQKHLLGNDTKT